LIVLFLLSSHAEAELVDPALQTALKLLDSDETLPVIIRLQNTVTVRTFKESSRLQRRKQFIKSLRKNAELTQWPLLTFLKSRGARQVTPLWFINAIAVTLRVELIHELKNHPFIKNIKFDETFSLPDVTQGSTEEPEWSINAIRAPELWNLGYTGEGMVIASMDSGVDLDHPDLTDKWRGGTNSWFDPTGEHEMPYDANGHGTQTMGIMVGGSAGGTAIGVAPGAQWIAVKIFNDEDETSLSTIHQGFQWLLDPDNNPETDDAPDVVNSSWGLNENINECVNEFREDIQVLKAAETAVVFSAGNDGPSPSTSISPANYPESFAVGAVDDNFTLLAFSSRGPSVCDGSIYPAVVAPGVNVRTSDLTFGGLFPNSYVTLTGTSFAAAHAAGAMALLLSANPCMPITELESIIKQSASDLGLPGPDNEFGFGVINTIATYNTMTAAPVTSTCPSTIPTSTSSTGSTSSVTTTTTQLLTCLIEELYGQFSEETVLLRRLRDTFLSKTQEGQEIIRLYYEWSPVIVKAMERDEELKEKAKNMIDELLPVIGGND
jgi:bacillopeptidase F